MLEPKHPRLGAIEYRHAPLGSDAAHLRYFADQSPDWEYWLGPDGRFIYVTPACQDICGHPPEAFLADADLMARLIHPDDQRIWQDHATLGMTPDSAHGHDNIELRIRDREGSWRWIEHCCNALFDAEGRCLGRRGVNRDISRRKQVESDLANLSDVYRTLRAVYQVIFRAEDEVDLLNEVCRLCVEFGGASACVISIGTEGSEELYPIAFHGLDQGDVDAMPLHAPQGRGNIPPVTVWENGSAACCPDCHASNIDDLWATWSTRAEVASCCHYPLRRGGRQYGLISLLSKHKAYFQPTMLELFKELANDLSYALDDFDTRYRAEQSQYSLRQREAHLRALLDSAPTGIGIVINRNFVEVNERFCAMLGYLAEEIVGESARMIYPTEEEYQRVTEDKYGQIAKYGHGQIRTRMRRKDGSMLDVFLSSMALDRNDLSKGVVFTALDITEARQFEEALRKSESRYRLIAENSGDIISVHDMHGACRFVTPACMRVVGWSQEEIIGRVGFLDIHEEDVGRVHAAYADVLAGGEPGPHEYRLRRSDGSLVWVESTASLIMGIDDTEVLVITRDISARKSVEAALVERQDRYRQLVEHMSDGVAVYQAVHDGADFVISDFNHAGERIAGMARPMVIGKPVTEAFPGIRELGLFEVFQRVWRTGVPESLPACQYIDGRIMLWVENYVFKLPSGEIVAVFNDITTEKTAENRLRLIAKLFDSTTEGMLITDAQNRILLVNRAFTVVTGYTEHEVVGENPSFLASGQHDATYYQAMWQALNTQGTWRGEIWNRRKDGVIYPEFLMISAVKDSQGQVTHYTAVFSDITNKDRFAGQNPG